MAENRAEQVKSERRRKPGVTTHLGLKLGVDESKLDREKFAYRFVNDTPGRLSMLTEQDDWEFVEDPSKAVKDDSTNEGGRVSAHAGVTESNKPMRAYLLRKPKGYFEDDQKSKQTPIDDVMTAIKRGAPQSAEARKEAATAYVPEGGINIKDR